MNGLVAHVDTSRATRQQVIDVPTPDRTQTWGVIGHGQLVETLTNAVENAEGGPRQHEAAERAEAQKHHGIGECRHAAGEAEEGRVGQAQDPSCQRLVCCKDIGDIDDCAVRVPRHLEDLGDDSRHGG